MASRPHEYATARSEMQLCECSGQSAGGSSGPLGSMQARNGPRRSSSTGQFFFGPGSMYFLLCGPSFSRAGRLSRVKSTSPARSRAPILVAALDPRQDTVGGAVQLAECKAVAVGADVDDPVDS